MSIDVSIEVDPGGGRVATQMTLIHNTILIWRQSELVFSILILRLDIAIDCITIGHNTGGLSLGLSIVEDAIVQSLNKINS